MKARWLNAAGPSPIFRVARRPGAAARAKETGDNAPRAPHALLRKIEYTDRDPILGLLP
ncbi:MAG: hypothetical protein BroJett024_25760 [Alphaproteobacteria bacterium]|nr:MAG: hypothetical protein BroJett024_25760 [Alphaproteobacteria bacterium]